MYEESGLFHGGYGVLPPFIVRCIKFTLRLFVCQYDCTKCTHKGGGSYA